MFLIDKLKILFIKVINNNEIKQSKKLNTVIYNNIKNDCTKWRHEDLL